MSCQHHTASGFAAQRTHAHNAKHDSLNLFTGLALCRVLQFNAVALYKTHESETRHSTTPQSKAHVQLTTASLRCHPPAPDSLHQCPICVRPLPHTTVCQRCGPITRVQSVHVLSLDALGSRLRSRDSHTNVAGLDCEPLSTVSNFAQLIAILRTKQTCGMVLLTRVFQKPLQTRFTTGVGCT